MLGNYGGALNAIHEGMAKAEDRGNRYFASRFLNQLGWFHGLLGDFTRAAAHNQECAELGRTFDLSNPEISALINLGADYVGQGQYERARSHLEAMLERIERAFGSHRWLWRIRLHNVLAEACDAMGDHEEALRCVEVSLSTAVATSVRKYMAKGWALRGRILAHLGKAEAVGTDLQRAFALAEKLNSPSILYPIALSLGQWYEAAGQEREAAELYGKAKSTVERMAAAVDDEALRAIFLQWAPIQAIYESFARVG